jgi:preprotein translocase subunit YajC
MFDHLPLVLAQEDARPTAPTPTPAPVPANNNNANNGAAPPATEGQPGTVPIDPQKNPQQQQPAPGGSWFLPAMLLIFLVVMFGMTFLSQRREKKKRTEMLGAMKKNDKVVTIGGIIGTVVEVRDAEVVLKVDEGSNTRMKFSRAAIQSIIDNTSDLPEQ